MTNDIDQAEMNENFTLPASSLEKTSRNKVKSRDRTKPIAISAKSIPVYCITLNKSFASASAAARELDLHQSAICNVLKQKRKHTGGLTFVYLETTTNEQKQTA